MYLLTPERQMPKQKYEMNRYTKEFVNHDDLNTFTIDPTLSVDFDDAISVDVKNRIVYIHIVDIAGQTLLGSGNQQLIDKCFSLYLSEHTEHLLDQEDAATNLSLVVGKQRRVITIKAKVNEQGLVDEYDIYKSTIIVKTRYNYKEVLDYKMDDPDIAFLAKLSEQRSASIKYDINIPCIRIINDTIVTENSSDIAHSLVATVMILGNIIVSKHLMDLGIELPNRLHKKLRGIEIPDNFKPTDNETINSYLLIKQFSTANYSMNESGHFGLGITNYVHFTSPMRRYADYLVHRILAGWQYENLYDEIVHINHRQKILQSIDNLYNKWKITKFLENHEKLEDIYITGLNKSGILWFCPKYCVNGFIHVSTIKPIQYWKFKNDTLIGQSKTLCLYDKFNADIKSIDLFNKSIILEIINSDADN